MHSELGEEELGKRGCYSKDVSALDIDLKARYLTTEELSHAIGRRLSHTWKIKQLSRWVPSPWWDRGCDLALIIGTFLHGLSNYRAMHMDDSLLFARKIEDYKDKNRVLRFERLRAASEAARSVFDDAIVSLLNSQEAQVKKEKAPAKKEEASVKIEEGVQDEPVTRDIQDANLEVKKDPSPGIQEQEGIETDGDESDAESQTNAAMISLPDLCRRVQNRLKETASLEGTEAKIEDEVAASIADAKYLDDRLFDLVNLIETTEETMDVCTKPGASTTSNKNVFTALCNELGLVERQLSGFHSPLAFDFEVELDHSNLVAGPGVPTSLSRCSVTAFAYMDECTTISVSELDDACESQDQGQYIPVGLREDDKLRNAICAAVLSLGTTHSRHFMSTIRRLSGSSPTISQGDINHYVQETLIPHCARLCLLGIKEEVSNKLGIETYKDVILPDPILPLSDHSPSSLEIALALLRRTKLYSAIINIAHLPQGEVTHVIERIENHKDEVPIWWDTNYDWELLCHAAHNGLLHVTLERNKNENIDEQSLFHPHAIQLQIRTFLFQGSGMQKPLIPPHIVQNCTQDDMDDFVEKQANNFPCALTIERRLSVLCNEISREHLDKNWAFVDLPMVDHSLFRRA